MKQAKRIHNKIFAAVALLLVFTLLLLPAGSAAAKGGENTVRVGWFESPFNTTDSLGRRSGYSYEYQQKVAAYAGWNYEYIEGSWPELLQMLIDGKIDLLSDVSFTKERAAQMHFSSLPMGEEEYYLYTTPGNADISAQNLSTLNGKKVGANADSIQAELFQNWANNNDLQVQLKELSGTESENMAALVRGDIDMYVTLNAIADAQSMVPVCKIGSSGFYFAVSKERPELVQQLNAAMNRIQDDNPYFNQQLYTKYLQTAASNVFLSEQEKEWLQKHGTIRVAYQDNYLAFCGKDSKTGELTGALKDYLAVASDCLENAHLDFEAVAYPTSEAALEAVKNGEADCMFPANLTDYYGEIGGYLITAPLMTTDMSAIVQESNQKSFAHKERITVAVNAGNPNYDMFLLDHFPEWQSVYFKDTQECLRAVADGKADCLLISNFRYNNIASTCEKYHLVSVSTGVEMDYCLAVNRDNATLYSIFNKINSTVPASTINASLSHYFTEDAKTGIGDIFAQNWLTILIILLIAAVVIIFLIRYNTKAKKKAIANKQLILATQTDSLTGLYNNNYFLEYAYRLFRADPKKPMDAIVLNIERFHSINAIHSYTFGDRVLHELGSEIAAFLDEHGGIAGRSQADRFVMYCPQMTDYRALYERLQNKLDALSSRAGIHLRMGIMPWQEGMEPQQQIEQALIACNMARGLYKEHMIVFDDAMRKKEAFEQRLLNDWRHALEHNEFEVYYQPKYDIQSNPPKLDSAEALVRWNHPKYGMIAPIDFIPLFERNGQIIEIDKAVWAQAAAQVAQWRDKYGTVLPVSINLSRVDIFDPQLEVTLEALLETNHLAHNALTLEVTESAYTENTEEFIAIVGNLRKQGFQIAMDDFGSGYSSLHMLSSMPIDALKMDGAFIKDIKLNHRGVQLVELILDIAEDLKVPVIAEGVENETQLQLLKNMGCAQAQGYYFSKPLPAEQFEKEILEKK
ncbi:MAG: EAL domain-containing protein [Clostridia bacterium]|nr:EAL domain-containing protein [Clostridia bacterium]